MNRFVAAEPALRPAPPRRLVDAVREVLCDDGAAPAVRPQRAELAEPADVAGALGHGVIVADRGTDLYRQARRTDRLTFARGRQPEYACATFAGNLDRSATADHVTLYTANGGGEGATGPCSPSTGCTPAPRPATAGTANARRPARPRPPAGGVRPTPPVPSRDNCPVPHMPVADDDALVVCPDRYGPRRTT